MGFFSNRCAVSNESIPAYPYAGFSEKESEAILILPNNEKIEGIYDGYGRFYKDGILQTYNGKEHFPEYIADFDHSEFKRLFVSDNYALSIDKWHYEQPLTLENVKDIQDQEIADLITGKTLNEIKKTPDFYIETPFSRQMKLIKMVKKKYYKGEKYNDLKTSESCEHQGYFYGRPYDFKSDAKR